MEQIVFKFQIDWTASLQNVTYLDDMINKMAETAGDSSYKSQMSITLKNHLGEIINKAANPIYTRLKDLWTNRIKNGEVTPELTLATLKAKTLKGYTSPESPLYASGEFAENFGIGDITENSIDFIVDANVLPSWHGASLYVEPTLADGVPIRQPITESEANDIVYEEFYNAYESSDFGEKIQKPDKMTFSVSSNVSVATSDSAGNDKLKKKKNKKLKGVKVASKVKRSTQNAKTKAVKNSKLRGRR